MQRARAPGRASSANGERPGGGAICRRLDGLPLALAAGCVLTPEALDEQLARNRLSVLTSGLRDADERHQTLRRTLDWSLPALGGGPGPLPAPGGLRRGLHLEAAGGRLWRPARPGQGILAGLGALIDQSLLGQEEHPQGARLRRGRPGPADTTRYVMLETVREYAAERLARSAEGRPCAAAPPTTGPWPGASSPSSTAHEAAWFARLAQEQRNFRLALRWAWRSRPRATVCAWRLPCGASGTCAGHWVEAGEWTEALLALPGAAAPSAERAHGLWLRGILAWMRRDPLLARPALEESLALARAGGDQAATANALYGLGVVARAPGAGGGGGPHRRGHRHLARPGRRGPALPGPHLAGHPPPRPGRAGPGPPAVAGGLALCHARGYAVGAGWALDVLGTIALAEGDLERAAVHFKEGGQALRGAGRGPGGLPAPPG